MKRQIDVPLDVGESAGHGKVILSSKILYSSIVFLQLSIDPSRGFTTEFLEMRLSD
jgi:hypothetical protein